MTALVPRLIDTHPGLVGAVRQGIPIVPPEDIRFLMAIAPDKTAAIVEGAHEAVAIQVSSGDGGVVAVGNEHPDNIDRGSLPSG